MFDFIKKYKITIIVAILLVLGIGAYFGYQYYIDNVGEYNPYSNGIIDEIVDYDINRYNVIYKNEIDVYRAYYKEYMILLADEPAKAFNKLTPETKSSSFNDSYDNFLSYQQSLDKKILKTSDIIQYTRIDNVIYVIDKYNNHFEFHENGVWNYTVSLYK